jgi:hypothetical protein
VVVVVTSFCAQPPDKMQIKWRSVWSALMRRAGGVTYPPLSKK